MEEKRSKWQPILLIADKRVECECGALAIFVILNEIGEHNEWGYTAWCQDCFEKAQEEVEA